MLLNAETAKLTPKEEKALLCLLKHPTLSGAAKEAGISETTLYRMMQEPAFVEAYAEARREAVQQSIGLLQKGSGAAVATLINVMQAQDTPATAKISAARSILEYSFKGAELLDIEERLAALEAVQETQEAKS